MRSYIQKAIGWVIPKLRESRFIPTGLCLLLVRCLSANSDAHLLAKFAPRGKATLVVAAGIPQLKALGALLGLHWAKMGCRAGAAVAAKYHMIPAP